MPDEVKTYEDLRPSETGLAEEPEENYKCGYFVGLKNDGGLAFEPFGPEQGLIELLGLHEYAGIKIREPVEQAKSVKTNQALTIIAKMLTQLLANQKVPKPE